MASFIPEPSALGRICLYRQVLTASSWHVTLTGLHLFERQLRGKVLTLNIYIYEGWNFNSGNYLFTTDTK